MSAKPKLHVDVNYASPAVDDSLGLAVDFLRSPSPLARGASYRKAEESFALEFSNKRCLSDSNESGFGTAQPYSGTVAPLFYVPASRQPSDGMLELLSPISKTHPIETEAMVPPPPTVAMFATRPKIDALQDALPVGKLSRRNRSTSCTLATPSQPSPHREQHPAASHGEAATNVENTSIASLHRQTSFACPPANIDGGESVELGNSETGCVWSLAAEDGGMPNTTSGQFAPEDDHVLYFHEDH